MAKNSTDFMMNTLRGKIWLAVSALAVLNCFFGLLAYLAASFFTGNTFFIVLVAFMLTSFSTMVFGWWISNEVLRPIEKVNMLAKSLERSPAVSLPKTTGSSETDELLQTLHRNSQQLHNLMGMMDGVSSGNTETALTPLQNSDRLSTSFQKLVSKVTDSVDAGKELSQLQNAVSQLIADLATVKNGNLDVNIRSGFPETKAISDAVRSLLSRQSELVRHIQVNAADANRSSMEARKLIRTAIENDDNLTRKIKRATAVFTQTPGQLQQISTEVSATLSGVGKSMKDFEAGKRSASETANAIQGLRKQITAASQKLQRIHGQSEAITQVSKLAEDLARRSNMIALNTSIQAGSANGGSVSLIADEIASLSERAGRVNDEVSVINESIVREVEDAQAGLKMLIADVTAISDETAKSGEAMDQLAPFFDGLVHLKTRIEAGQNEGSSDMQQLLSILDECSADSNEIETNLKDCDQAVAKFSTPLENLRDSIIDLRTASNEKMKAAAEEDFSADFGTHSDAQSSEPLELQGEN
ncbi:MAG: methyl-accepting chemotaxis protein [Saprospiraceae bacterium]|nr:methyl-accepting chemotaxis protein [Pyrinomonadaceae bacterium]